jgi:hypothetical protein
MELETLDHIEGPTLWISAGVPLAGPRRGGRTTGRLVGMASPQLRDDPEDRALIAMQIADNDGPFDNAQQFRQGNALVKWKGQVGKGELKLAHDQ